MVLTVADFLISSWKEELIENKYINFLSIDFSSNEVYMCIACIILSFSFHNYTFSLYECLDSPDTKKMIITSSVGIMISILIYLIVGTIDYIMYGESIKDSILDTLGFSPLAVLENISFVLNVVMSFPVTFSAVKNYIILLLQLLITAIKERNKKEAHAPHSHHAHEVQKTTQSINDENHSDNEEDQHQHGHHKLVEIGDIWENIITLLIFLGIFYFAISNPNMKPVK